MSFEHHVIETKLQYKHKIGYQMYQMLIYCSKGVCQAASLINSLRASDAYNDMRW